MTTHLTDVALSSTRDLKKLCFLSVHFQIKTGTGWEGKGDLGSSRATLELMRGSSHVTTSPFTAPRNSHSTGSALI